MGVTGHVFWLDGSAVGGRVNNSVVFFAPRRVALPAPATSPRLTLLIQVSLPAAAHECLAAARSASVWKDI